MWLIKSTKHSYTHTWGAAQTPNVYALKNIGPSYTHAHTMLGQAYTHEHTKKVKHTHARTQENMHTHSRDGRRRRRISLGRRQVAFIFCMPACCVCAWEYWWAHAAEDAAGSMSSDREEYDMVCQRAVTLIVDLCLHNSTSLDQNTCQDFLFLLSGHSSDHKEPGE